MGAILIFGIAGWLLFRRRRRRRTAGDESEKQQPQPQELDPRGQGYRHHHHQYPQQMQLDGFGLPQELPDSRNGGGLGGAELPVK